MDKIFQEEERHLAETEKRISRKASHYEDETSRLAKEILDFVVYDYSDIEVKQQLIRDREANRKSAEWWHSMEPSPYFGRLDLDCDDDSAEIETQTFYIGKEAITDSTDVLVVDWRTPIGSCYYASNQKEFIVKNHKYLLALRRALDVRNAKLLSYQTEYDGETVSLEGDVIDPFLLTVLKDKRRHNRLTDIIRTIQGNQNEIIRKSRTESFVVQGCAGSGKTMILLHRLSYLKFNNRAMSLSGIKIITPNKYFDAHINDLSVELGLTAIDRFSVEEYYVFLIKKYYSKANVTADVCSEKSLNPKLLEDIYSLQYLDNSIAHYHEYWEQILTALNQPKLQEYFARFTLIYPNTALHTAATVVQMEQSLQQILITISAAEKKKESVTQRIEATSKEIEVVQQELDNCADKLVNAKNQVITRFEIESITIEETIQEIESKITVSNTQRDELIDRRSRADADLTKVKAVINMFSHNTDAYTNYDQFVLIDDTVSQIIRREYATLIQEISDVVQLYQKTPIYNFGKRNTLRKQLTEKKATFTEKISSFIDAKLTMANNEKDALQSALDAFDQGLISIDETIQNEKKRLHNQKGRLSALNECANIFASEDLPDTKSLLSTSAKKELSPILSSYEEQRLVYNRLHGRVTTLEQTKNRLEIEYMQYVRDAYTKEDEAYIRDCSKILKQLQMSEISRNVMFKDLLGQYKQYNQRYQKTNYRHKIYLKLLYCALYFARPLNSDTFLNIDEAQDISIAEYHLLRMVLGEKCIFNLYGDINQSVYSYKGIADWDDISDITSGNVYVLNENYRNTLQITDFCNKEFEAEVYPIGISGDPVVEMDAIAAVKWILEIKRLNSDYRVAIIHRHGLKAIQEFLHSILDKQDVSWYSVDDTKLSVVSVETAKGLEFEAVVAIVDQMSANEKYISYTRALDHLAVVRDHFSAELEIDETGDEIDDEFIEPIPVSENLIGQDHSLANSSIVDQTPMSADWNQKAESIDTVEHNEGRLTSQSDGLYNTPESPLKSNHHIYTDKELSNEDSILIAEFNSILEERFGPEHTLSVEQQNIVLALYHGKSVACNAPSGSMKSVMLYLLAMKEHLTSGKQTLLTAESHLQENSLVLADRLGLKGGIISTMEEFLADFKKEKYDVIFVSYDFFKQHENISLFVDYFDGKVAYWGIDHPAFAKEVWKQINNCGAAIQATMYLMAKTGFENLDLSNYLCSNIESKHEFENTIEHMLSSPDEKSEWILDNLSEINGQGLIYCTDETTCINLSKLLRKRKILAEAYIDVANPENKEKINYLTNSFSNGGIPVLITTHDAGKNLSNPHIRFIVHYDMPEDEVVYRLHEMQVGQLADNPVIHNLCLV